jgi:NDP-sugar pyrophosphorylase family protein
VHAIILAGGRGERLRPLTDDRPKGMVEIAGRPILAHQIAWLRFHGIDDITISCGYLADVIQAFFGDGSAFDVRIRYAIEREPLGRGGGFRYALGMIETADPVVGTNGDIITNLNLTNVIERHRSAGVVATDVLVPMSSPYGVVDIDDDDRVVGFREKPELPYWLNAGIYVFDPSIRERLPERGDHEDTTFPALAAERRLLGFRSRAFWRAADTAKDVGELNKALAEQAMDRFFRFEGKPPSPSG